jgi:hypothetical protein
MLLLSLNLRGIGGSLKLASIRRVLDRIRPEIKKKKNQETLVSDVKARDFLLVLRPSWVACSVSAVGKSGGLLAAWDPSIFSLEAAHLAGGILLSGSYLVTNRKLVFFNLYGPCQNKFTFWKSIVDSGVLSLPNLILAGDLNIILAEEEVWGGSGNILNMDDYFKTLFQSNNLVDVKPAKLTPTWRNGRSGQDAISRRLDRVLVSDQLLSVAGNFRSWVESPFVSDHAPIYFQMEQCPVYKSFPFKFNASWLNEKDYVDLILKTWKDPMFFREENYQLRLLWKLQVAKKLTKSWVKENRKKKKFKT